MKPELKKLLILNAPYLLFVYLFDKIGQAAGNQFSKSYLYRLLVL